MGGGPSSRIYSGDAPPLSQVFATGWVEGRVLKTGHPPRVGSVPTPGFSAYILFTFRRPEASVGQIPAQHKRDGHVPVETMCVAQRSQVETRRGLRRQQQEQQALNQRQPADDGDHDRQRAARPDVVSQNHRQPGGQHYDSECKHQRSVVNQGDHRLHGCLLVRGHGERREDEINAYEFAKKNCAWSHRVLHSEIPFVGPLSPRVYARDQRPAQSSFHRHPGGPFEPSAGLSGTCFCTEPPKPPPPPKPP